MSIVFQYNNKTYPDFIRKGNHAQYILPAALQVCEGRGIDIGCSREEWAFPNTDKCDLTMESPWDNAMEIPREDGYYNFVFSSHCLEHLDDYYAALQEWTRIIKSGGILFLYLPSIECEYWRPANDRKHKHILYTKDIVYDLNELGYNNVCYSGVDMAYSYSVFGIKE